MATPNTTDTAVEAVTGFWQHPMVQRWLIDTPLQIAIILVIAIILHFVLRRLVTRLANHNITNGGRLKRSIKVARGSQTSQSRQESMMTQAQEKRRQSRIKTIAGVLNSAVTIIVWTWAVMAILSELDVNIAPLIASAGIVGVALGFGAQSLVKDFLSGIFMLIEDQYGIGDTIDVGDGIIGDIEDISLRITTVRDIDGTLWYVRNGEILRVGNLSDGYAIARIEIPVGFNNDAIEVWDALNEIVAESAKDEQLSDLIIDTPEINGVTSVSPDYMTYRISIKTLPGDQWSVQRLTNAHIINALRERGITLAYPHGMGAIRNSES